MGWWERVGNLACALVCFALLWTGQKVEPSGTGHGSHVQLGLPMCAWVMRFDKPCPTCGMTTAVAHAVRGEFLNSVVVQPAGAAFALGAAALFWLSLYVAATGSAVGRMAGRALLQGRWLWSAGVLVGVSWAYKFLTW